MIKEERPAINISAKNVVFIICVMIVIYVQHMQLTYSTTVGIRNLILMDIRWQLLNILIAALPFIIMLLVTGRLYISLYTSCMVVFIYSMANYYTLYFHGYPLLASELLSVRTAMKVLHGYQLTFSPIVLRLLILFIADLGIVTALFCWDRKRKRIRRRFGAIVLSIWGIAIYFIFFSTWTLFPDSVFDMSWGKAVNRYGYEVCLANSVYLIKQPFHIPKGYDANLIQVPAENEDNESVPTAEELPDVILILNETFADLSVYADIDEAKEILRPLENDSKIIHGYSTVSMVGGGTNNSEYELLTSNSMRGISFSAPFLCMNMEGVNSIVSYFNDLGYHTVGMHCGDKINYARNTAYPAIGFDTVLLGKESFKNDEGYDRRKWLDEGNYQDLMDVYRLSEGSPQFLYLLTYQNHGGYEQNPHQSDTVSLNKDFGEYTDDINEYLSSLEKSVASFENLIKSNENNKRKTIILMVGDHMPMFISQLPPRNDLNTAQREIAQLQVPYYVWSNYDIDTSVFSNFSSMVDLVPMLLKASNLPLTIYDRTILKLNEQIPIRTKQGLYMDCDENIMEISESMPHYNLIKNYEYMEYNNLRKGDDYRRDLFTVVSE